MRYRNLIFGAIVGAIIGSILGGVIFGGAILAFAFFATLFAVVGATFGAFVGAIRADLILVVDNRPYWPGDTVDVRISLNQRESFHLRGGQVELACVETYHDGGEGWDLVKFTHTSWRSAVQFLDGEQISDRLSGWISVKIPVPDDAPPSLKGEAAEMSWQVRASLDIPGARDIHRKQGLIVIPLVPDPSPPTAEGKTFYAQCVASLSLSSATVRAGETVDGRFTVQVLQDLGVESIRVELECWEKAGEKR